MILEKKRLLILDDDPDVIAFISHAAELFGFATRATTLPREMLHAMKEWMPTHLAIDLIMPDMDGVEVLRELADKQCNSAIIVTSGMGMKVLEAARRSAIKRGLNIVGVLPKPFSVHALRHLLETSDRKTEQVTPVHSNALSWHLSIDDLRAAIDSDDIIMHYQPKISLVDERVVGFEALVRWNHPVHGIVFPDAFIRAAEDSGLMTALTYRCFDIALRWIAHLEYGSHLTISMNMSAVTFADPDLVDRLYWSCLQAQVDPRRIILELTETSAVDTSAAVLDAMSRLRIKGFALGIDDFGTGYSTMMQLMRLPFSEIKIDRTFVGNMHDNDDSMTIVHSTIELGQRLGLTTVAEGVETAAQMQTLKTLHCDLAQGYHFSRPMSDLHVKRFLSERPPRDTGPLTGRQPEDTHR